MPCNRGRADPDATTKVRLFASSAGFCQNPECWESLFVEVGDRTVHFAEMAHIFSAQDDGPRGTGGLTRAERGRFENLILLCANCHTKIDKAPREFPDARIRGWKAGHEHRIAQLFGIKEYTSRTDARRAIEPLLDENAAIFRRLSPDLNYRFNPEAEEAEAWKQAMLHQILPNNRKLLLIADANRALLSVAEKIAVEDFRGHFNDLVNRHVGDEPRHASARFPPAFAQVFSENQDAATDPR